MANFFGVQPLESKTLQKDDSTAWDTIKVNTYLKNIQTGYKNTGPSPFFEGKINLKKGGLYFSYTEEEEAEILKCMKDATYFSDTYGYAMTDDGVMKISLRDYQKNVLNEFQENRYIGYLASRQVGKTVVSAIFIMWYICTNFDRNVLIVANKSATMKEILSKIKNVYENLPFFLKPGVLEYNKEGMVFDNGCRIFGQATSETPALGFTVHLLYADEFAHIPEHIVEPFYRSIFPTLSSSQISRIIITSTPNGTNKFYQLYTAALKGENSYKALRTDWWEVPGRDDDWKRNEINNLGSLELFNQEYGNQFLTADKLLIDHITYRKLEHIKKEYVEKYISELDDIGISSKNLLWRPDMNFNYNINKDRFIFSIDLADGTGGDYSVINIFKIMPLSISKIKSSKFHKKDSDFFRLVQVGFFRSNTHSINDVSKIINTLVFDIFDPEICKIILEVNHKGDYIIDKLTENKNFYIELLIHTKHSSSHDYLSPGVKINKKNKPFMCKELSEKLKNTKIVIDNDINIIEAQSFGLDDKGSYNSQIGHDDMMMTCVNMLCLFDNSMFDELIEDIYDFQDDNIKNLISKKMNGIVDEDDELDYNFLRSLNN